MPSDEHQPYTARDGNAPYKCSNWDTLPRPEWAIDYGVCRHSLEPEGRTDKRCPTDCKHRASDAQQVGFYEIYKERGARVAADWICNGKA